MQIKFEAWYRYDNEKDFYVGTIEASDWNSAEKQIKEKDSRIFKVEQL